MRGGAQIEYTEEGDILGVYLVTRIDRLCLGFAQWRASSEAYVPVPEYPSKPAKDRVLMYQKWADEQDAVAGIVIAHLGADFYKHAEVTGVYTERQMEENDEAHVMSVAESNKLSPGHAAS